MLTTDGNLEKKFKGQMSLRFLIAYLSVIDIEWSTMTINVNLNQNILIIYPCVVISMNLFLYIIRYYRTQSVYLYIIIYKTVKLVYFDSLSIDSLKHDIL